MNQIRTKINDVIEWLLSAGIIVFTLIIMGMTALSMAASDIPNETPPCPEEYKGGLRP